MPEYKLFAQRVGLVGVTNFIVGLRGLILIPILTKTLGVSGYGIWSLIIVTISLAMPLAMLGLPQAMVRFLAPEKDKKEIQEGFFSVSFTVLSFGLVLSLILFALSDFFALIIIKDISIAPIIRIAAFMIVLTAIDQTILSFFTAFRQMKKYSLFVISQNFIEVALIAYTVLSGFGISGAVIGLLTSRAILLAIMLPYIVSRIGFKLPNFSRLKSYLSFGLPMVPTTIFAWIIHSSDRYMIGYFMGSVPVGIYSAAYGIGFVIHMFINPVGIVLFPTVSKLWDEEKIAEFKTHLRYSLKYFLMLAIPSLFGLSVLAKELLLILSTSEFVSGAILIPFVASGLILYGAYNTFHYVLTSAKRTDLLAISLGTASVVNIALNILFIPIIGILGAAIATSITYTSVGIIVPFLSRRYLKFEIDWIFIVKSVVASLIMASLILIFNPRGLLEVIIATGGGGLIYFAILSLLRSFNKEEIKVFKDSLHIRRYN